MKSYKDKDKDKDTDKKNTHSTALFIGRFQPFHTGHLSVVQAITKLGYRQIIIGIGSAQYNGTSENPFSFSQRARMIKTVLAQYPDIAPTLIVALPDIHDEANWVQHINTIMQQADYQYNTVFSANAHVRNLFMQAGQSVQSCPQTINVNATQIRQWIIDKSPKWQQYVDPMIQAEVQAGVEQQY